MYSVLKLSYLSLRNSLTWNPLLIVVARTAMWSMPVVLTETENENFFYESNLCWKNDVAKMTLQKWRCNKGRALSMLLADGITSTNNYLIVNVSVYPPKRFMCNTYFRQCPVTSQSQAQHNQFHNAPKTPYLRCCTWRFCVLGLCPLMSQHGFHIESL